MLVVINGLFVCVYQTHFRTVYSRISRLQPALSHSSIGNKSIPLNSVRKPYTIMHKSRVLISIFLTLYYIQSDSKAYIAFP